MAVPAGLNHAVASEKPGEVEGLLGVEVIEETLPIYDSGRRTIRDPLPRDEFPPMRVLLSRYRYWAQDGHMDVIVRLDDSQQDAHIPDSALMVRLEDDEGKELAGFEIDPVPGDQFIFYPTLPERFLGKGIIELTWRRDGAVLAEDRQEFLVKVFDEPGGVNKRIPLRLANENGVALKAVPVTAGVPFPRGVLDDAAHLRLVDENGRGIPLQVMETARWSKFGSVRWALCDFTIDLDGGPRELFLEYGPDTRRSEREVIMVEKTDGFPFVDAGRVRIDRGLWFDAERDGRYEQVLEEDGLSGAFVEHEDGRFYGAPLRDEYEVEEIGGEKVVIRREGWYREEIENREFCKYITRYVIHRDSPLIRIFHTWIFTGDGNRDRIANMGWRFSLAQGFEHEAFLTGFGGERDWRKGHYLLQYDYEHFDIVKGADVEEFAGGRAGGAAAARGNGIKLYFGAKDFWQNYPSELEFSDGSLWFHNWPKHNRAAGHTFDKELMTEPFTGEPAISSSAARYEYEDPDRLSRSQWLLNVLQLRYAHEGETLDFRLPRRFGEPPIWSERISANWPEGEPDVVNAQGVSRTEEMWLYMTPESDSTGFFR